MVNLINILTAAADNTHFIARFIELLYTSIGNYGWAVVVFTLILKVAMSPLDVWQKVAMRKNNKAMERMKPELEKLQKQCGNNKELYQQKQMGLYKKNGYSMLGSCLPTIITLVLFFVIFAGFRAEATYTNAQLYKDMRTTYYTELEATDNIESAQAAVEAKFETDWKDKISFLWINNVFMPDNWKKSIADYKTYTSTGMGGVGVTDEYTNVENIGSVSVRYEKEGEAGYTEVMKALTDKYTSWNGYLILPLLVIVLSIFSQKLNKPMQPPSAPGGENTQAAMQANMKVMQYMMPAMFGIFALFYSSAFTLYMFVSSLFTTVFQFIYNIIAKEKDKKEEEERLQTTYK